MIRTDIHRKSAIIASDYRFALDYSLATVQDGWPVPSYGVNCMQAKHDPEGRCCWLGLLASGRPRASHGSLGQCTACGARFIFGEVWEHIASGELIHLGHECVRKYDLIADHTEFEGKRAAFAEREIRKARFAYFCEAHAGLADALAMDHRILADLSDKLRTYGSLSDKQVALALKIAGEIRNPPAKEATVPAPVGRADFTGEIVSRKLTEWGEKLTVKVTTDAGVWLAWGTCPKGCTAPRGARVSLRATLKPGRDAHFAIMSRPMFLSAE